MVAQRCNTLFDDYRAHLALVIINPKEVVSGCRIIVHRAGAGNAQHTGIIQCPSEVLAADTTGHIRILTIGLQQTVVVHFNGNFIPFGFVAVVANISQASATRESTITNSRQCSRNMNFSDVVAAKQSTLFDRYQVFRQLADPGQCSRYKMQLRLILVKNHASAVAAVNRVCLTDVDTCQLIAERKYI